MALFFVLAFLLSWYPWFIALARGRATGPNPLGPLVAALVVTVLFDGWPGLRLLLSRLGRWRIGIKWYAVGFLVPAAASILAGATVATPVIVFRSSSPAVAEAFAAADPYVTHSLVTKWRVREWTTVVGPDAAVPIGPETV